jgi:hypothetical protein
MTRGRGLSADHVTTFRWVQKYTPEFNKRMRPHLKMTGSVKKKVRASQCFRRFQTIKVTPRASPLLLVANFLRHYPIKRHGLTFSAGLTSMDRVREYAVNGDVVESLPRPDLRLVERGRERRVALGDQLHGALRLFGLRQTLGAA